MRLLWQKGTMRTILLFVLIATFGGRLLEAQDLAQHFALTGEPFFLSDPPSDDSISALPKRKLLPDKMSWLERGLWGESGVLRKVGLASPLTPEVRKSELSLRRTMLTVHQIGGFVTLGLMATTVYYGQKSLNNPDIRTYRQYHQGFVSATIASYTATALLAVLSPPPLIRRDEVSTTTIHKTLAWVHLVGMVVTPILGASLGRNFKHDKLAHFHQASAYVTAGALAASLIVITF
jgi:hypothetical protein